MNIRLLQLQQSIRSAGAEDISVIENSDNQIFRVTAVQTYGSKNNYLSSFICCVIKLCNICE